MKISIKQLCEYFKISRSKLDIIISRPEYNSFYLGKEGRTQYFDLNEESEALIKKWVKRRTRKNGKHELKGLIMVRIKLKDLANKYGYCIDTVRIILCRAEFDKYRDKNGRIITWNKEAENRFLKIMELKQGG